MDRALEEEASAEGSDDEWDHQSGNSKTIYPIQRQVVTLTLKDSQIKDDWPINIDESLDQATVDEKTVMSYY